MRIRTIRAQDDAVMRRIIRESLAAFGLDVPGTAYFDPQLSSLSAFYASPGSDYFVVTDDSGRVVGGAGYAPVDAAADNGEGSAVGVAELQKLYVSEDSRGSGASYELIRHVAAAAKNDGFTTLYLETHHLLKAAMHVYEREGFQEIDGPLGNAQHTTMDRFFVKSLVMD